MKAKFLLSALVMIVFFICSCGPSQQFPRQQDQTQRNAEVNRSGKKAAKPLPEEGGMGDPEILTPNSTNSKRKLEKPSPQPLQKMRKGKASDLNTKISKSTKVNSLNPQPLPPVDDRGIKARVVKSKNNNQ